MKHHWQAGWVAVGLSVIAAAVGAPAGAQGGLPGLLGEPPAAVSAEALRTAELARQITVLRALTRAKVPGETLAEIRELVAKSLAQLDAGDAAAVKDLASVKAQLAAAKRAVRRGGNGEDSTPEEVAAAGTQRRLVEQRASFLRQLGSQVEEILKKLTPEQRAAVVAAGQELVREQRAAQPGFGPGGPGSAERVAQDLDRLRNASAESWASERTRFAMVNGALPGGGLVAPGTAVRFAFSADGGPPGGVNIVGPAVDGPGGVAFRVLAPPAGGSGGGSGERIEVRATPGGDTLAVRAPAGGPGAPGGPGGLLQQIAESNPQMKARMEAMQALADQVRRMPPALYQQQRARLAKQVEDENRKARLNAPVSDDIALRILARELASKTGLAAMEAKR